jgi:mono/diheme cytochrome c family protein
VPTGTFAAGKLKYDSACASCHSAGSYDPNGSFGNIAGKQDLLVSNLGSISGVMNGITLQPQEILDLKAFLSAVQ